MPLLVHNTILNVWLYCLKTSRLTHARYALSFLHRSDAGSMARAPVPADITALLGANGDSALVRYERQLIVLQDERLPRLAFPVRILLPEPRRLIHFLFGHPLLKFFLRVSESFGELSLPFLILQALYISLAPLLHLLVEEAQLGHIESRLLLSTLLITGSCQTPIVIFQVHQHFVTYVLY